MTAKEKNSTVARNGPISDLEIARNVEVVREYLSRWKFCFDEMSGWFRMDSMTRHTG